MMDLVSISVRQLHFAITGIQHHQYSLGSPRAKERQRRCLLIADHLIEEGGFHICGQGKAIGTDADRPLHRNI